MEIWAGLSRRGMIKYVGGKLSAGKDSLIRPRWASGVTDRLWSAGKFNSKGPVSPLAELNDRALEAPHGAVATLVEALGRSRRDFRKTLPPVQPRAARTNRYVRSPSPRRKLILRKVRGRHMLGLVKPVKKRRKLPRRTGGLKVTVCVSGRSMYSNGVVGVSDLMLSFSDDSKAATDDATLKAAEIGDSWFAMWAGDDPDRSMSILDRIKNEIRRTVKSGTVLLPLMMRAVRKAYGDEWQEEVEARFLRKYVDLSLKDFWRSRRRLGAQEFDSTASSIGQFRLGVQLLICGVARIPHIFEVNEESDNSVSITGWDRLGHCAIGSGRDMALGALGGRRLSMLPLEDLTYRMCEAKFTAGTAGGVGQSTFVMIATKDGIITPFTLRETARLRKIWEKNRDKPAPRDARNLIKEVLDRSNQARRLIAGRSIAR